ncbi:MAG: YgiQ family radical SAM protein [Saccharofermentanales bacterium]
MSRMPLLPINRSEMEQRGWDELDFLFITGDAYVDHPSFGAAILTRILESRGYKVGVCPQPVVTGNESLQAMGRPRFGVFVSSGVVDSMVNNYTAAKRRRNDDRYSAGGAGHIRPDRALTAYCGAVRRQFGDIPLVVGGVEASLRRFAHYDYWSDTVRRSILQDCDADILVYGMGETPIVEIADLLVKGVNVKRINSLRGTCVFLKKEDLPNAASDFIEGSADPVPGIRDCAPETLKTAMLHQNGDYMLLPSYEEVAADKLVYALAFRAQYEEQDPLAGKTLIQRHSSRYVVQNPPSKPMSIKEMDAVYALLYERRYHDMYIDKGGVPSIEEVSFSITSHRGCFGGCNFCAITFHQGRIVQRRSVRSVVEEAARITRDPGFKGYIHDVGGPTANFINAACARQRSGGVCKHRACLSPEMCPKLEVSHKDYLEVLRRVRAVPGVKKVFVRSGVRFDYVMADPDRTFLHELCSYHISGQLKVAPEHVSENVLRLMGKPGARVYDSFMQAYACENRRLGKKQFLVPYLISGHPGSTMKDAIELAIHIKHNRVVPQQVQDFYPTPGTVSTTMYYTGINPLTFEPVYVPDYEAKEMQRALLQFSKPENRKLVEKALASADRLDLIGFGPDCLIPPYNSRSHPKAGPGSGPRRPRRADAADRNPAGAEPRKGNPLNPTINKRRSAIPKRGDQGDTGQQNKHGHHV